MEYFLEFMVFSSLLLGAKLEDSCGRITVIIDNSDPQEIGFLDFEKLSPENLRNATFYPNKTGNCRIKVCGFRSNDAPFNESDGCLGSKSDTMDCIHFPNSRSNKIDEDFKISSISCGCDNRKPACNAICAEKRLSANSDKTWKANECAILYRDHNCENCFYEPIKLQQNDEFESSFSHHISSFIVRDECTLSEEIPGYKKLCRYKNSSEQYTYTSSDKFTAKSAFLRDFPERFSCTCGTSIGTSPVLPSTFSASSSATGNLLTPNSSGVTVSQSNIPNSSSTTTTKPVHSPAQNSSDTVPTTGFKVILGVICVCLVAALGISMGLFISRRRILLLRSKNNQPSNPSSNAPAEYNNVEVMEHPVEFLYDTNVHNFSLNSSYEICSEHFKLGVESLGGGHFGDVSLGSLQVAVKTVRKNTKDEMLSKQSLEHEIKILSYLGSHENVIRFLGASVNPGENGEIFLITEYCPHGSLKDYLIHEIKPYIEAIIRTEMLKGFKIADDGYPETGYACNIDAKLKDFKENLTHDLEELDPAIWTRFMQWSSEIANGMEYITAKKVVHVDLAARNVLLTHNLTAKIGDFGLSKKIYLKEYVNSNKNYFPILWVAPESFMQGKYSSKSDIWAYGVTVWEIFSLGKDPYDEMSSREEVLGAIIQGKGLNRAEYASDYVHSKLTECWRENPEDRPSFSDLKGYFSLERTQI